ncbi:hypothetical protein MP638_005311 [Amoeboaphelidium occidentale]|nr:hypothetical protein MP638_005311 [Amoeboaphelidium occidentale]
MGSAIQPSYASAASNATGYQRVWYKLVEKDGNPFAGATVGSVILPGGAMIDDLRDSVKAKNSNKLALIDSSDLIVYLNEYALKEKKEPLKEDDLVYGLAKSKKDALWVAVPHVSNVSIKTGSTTKQQKYKGLSVESSCRKYLDTLASKLALDYGFQWGTNGNASSPSIGDVLQAKEKNEWEHYTRWTTLEERTSDDGFLQPKQRVNRNMKDLPNLFTAVEWNFLKTLNDKTNKRIHSAALPTDNSGKPFVIVSHDDYTKEVISLLQEIAFKGDIVGDKSLLVVKDEEYLSGTSSSESGSPK